MRKSRLIAAAVAAAAALSAGAAAPAWSQAPNEANSTTSTMPQRFGSHYQQTAGATCDGDGAVPCTIAFSLLEKSYLKVLKVSCSIKTAEGGSPSKEITGAVLGRLTANQKTFAAGQYLAPTQTEFAGAGEIVINFLADTLWVVPVNFRPAIQITRLNGPSVKASCSVAGEETFPK